MDAVFQGFPTSKEGKEEITFTNFEPLDLSDLKKSLSTEVVKQDENSLCQFRSNANIVNANDTNSENFDGTKGTFEIFCHDVPSTNKEFKEDSSVAFASIAPLHDKVRNNDLSNVQKEQRNGMEAEDVNIIRNNSDLSGIMNDVVPLDPIQNLQHKLLVLFEERDHQREKISLARQGYNDVGIDLTSLETKLKSLEEQIKKVESQLEKYSPNLFPCKLPKNLEILKRYRRASMESPHISSSSESARVFHKNLMEDSLDRRRTYSFACDERNSEWSSSRSYDLSTSYSRKFCLQLKRDLSPLDPRISFYTRQERHERKKECWKLDEVNRSEVERIHRERFEKEIAFLRDRKLEIEGRDIEFMEMIGEGSSCKVYRGRWQGREVALKMFKSKPIPFIDKLFMRELSKLYRLQSEHNVLLYGICLNPPCMVLEYMAGGTLYKVLHERGVRMDILMLMQIAKELALGMSQLHYTMEMLHRNLSSHQIFLTSGDANSAVKIGTPKFSRERKETCDGTTGGPNGMKGTDQRSVRWRSPEQIRGLTSYSGKVDVYGYGLILYELVTAKIPYRRLDGIMAAAKAAYEGLRPTIPSSCPPILRNLIASCWHSDPEQRPSFHEVLKFFAHVEGKLFFASRGVFWTMDKERELERERRRQERFQEIIQFLKAREFLVDQQEITLGPKIGAGSFAKVWEGNLFTRETYQSIYRSIRR